MINLPDLRLNIILGRHKHGIYLGKDCLLECDSKEDAEYCLRKNVVFRQLKSIGLELEIKPIK